MTDPVDKEPVFTVHVHMYPVPDWAKVEMMIPSALVMDVLKFMDDLRIKLQNAH